MNADISLYKKISDEISRYKNKLRGAVNELQRRLSKRDFDIRKMYYTLYSLKIYDRISYATLGDDALKTLAKLQLSDGDLVTIINVKYREKNSKEVSSYAEGGFPDVVTGKKNIIINDGPSIDSTIYSLQAIVDYVTEIQYWDDLVDDIIRRGIEYLKRRDINRDGFLEQYRGEDWLYILDREGILLYNNSLYLKLLEDLYYLYLDKDRDYSEKIKRLYTRLYRNIEKYFWSGQFYLEYINESGVFYLRTSIDSSVITRPLITRDKDRLNIHLETMFQRLYNKDLKLILASEAKIRLDLEDRAEYYLSIPYNSIIYSMDAALAGNINLAMKILNEIIRHIEYENITITYDGKISSKKRLRDTYFRDLTLLATYKLISDMIKEG